VYGWSLSAVLEAITLPESRLHRNSNNTFTWSRPNRVFGFTGQRRVAPAVGELHVEPTRPPLIHQGVVCLVDPSFLNSNPRLVATSQEAG
jgi:hypothetical protein